MINGVSNFFVYLGGFFGALVLSLALTLWAREIALKKGIVDDPLKDLAKKKHLRSIPLLGGIGLMGSFLICLVFFIQLGSFDHSVLLSKHLFGIMIAIVLIAVGGTLDDIYSLSPKKQLVFPVLAVLVIIGCGIGINFVTHPFGGILHLDEWRVLLFWFDGLPYYFVVLADLFTFVWLLAMMYSTSIFDGLDGLVSGISIIAGMVLFLLSLAISLPEVALLAILFVGAQVGFWFLNFNPAKIFLGEAGALFSGFILGVLAILGSGKVATTFLVMGIPLMDMVWLVLRRIFIDHKSPVLGDRNHLHHRFLEAGFSERKAVFFIYFFSAFFGILALFLQTGGKMIAVLFLILTLIFLGGWLHTRFSKKIC